VSTDTGIVKYEWVEKSKKRYDDIKDAQEIASIEA